MPKARGVIVSRYVEPAPHPCRVTAGVMGVGCLSSEGGFEEGLRPRLGEMVGHQCSRASVRIAPSPL